MRSAYALSIQALAVHKDAHAVRLIIYFFE